MQKNLSDCAHYIFLICPFFICFLDQVVANLFNILEREGSPEQIGSALRPLIRRNNEAGSDIKKSLHELETIINYAQSLGVKAKIIISPGLIFQSEHFRFVSLILYCAKVNSRFKKDLNLQIHLLTYLHKAFFSAERFLIQ